MTRDEIVSSIATALPGRDKAEILPNVEGALSRLRKKHRINYTGRDESYHLHFNERQRRDNQALEILEQRDATTGQLIDLTRSVSFELEIPLSEEKLDQFIEHLESLFELVLERQGNEFAEAVRIQAGSRLDPDTLQAAEDYVSRQPNIVGTFSIGKNALVDLLANVLTRALFLGGAVQVRLRQLADSYTLLAFLRETPDVQNAVSEFFSRGTLVFDTTALLPCFGETLLPSDEQSYTNLIRGALDAGLTLCTTAGVCNEIYYHFLRAEACSRIGGAWEGAIPLAYQDWLRFGEPGSFSNFVERLAASEEDVQFFLERGLGFRVLELDAAAEKMDQGTRHEVEELWRPRKRVRRGGSEMERDILLRHDIEMYFGVLGLRKSEDKDLYGHESWWVTEDATGLGMHQSAVDNGVKLPSDPCMNPAFLSTMLAIGPPRGAIATHLRVQLPVALKLHQLGYGLDHLSRLANEIRAEFVGEPEWLLRRRIRDRMNEIKRSRGIDVDDYMDDDEAVNVSMEAPPG